MWRGLKRCSALGFSLGQGVIGALLDPDVEGIETLPWNRRAPCRAIRFGALLTPIWRGLKQQVAELSERCF